MSLGKYVISAIGVLVGIFVISMAGKIFENIPADQIVSIQAPISGEIKWYTEPGLVYQGFGKETYFPKRFNYWFSEAVDQGTKKDESIKVRFNDGAHAWLSGGVSCEMPTDKATLDQILMKYGTFASLQHDLIRPVYEKSIYMTGPLMSSKESASEKRPMLISYIEDQAARGVYATKQSEVREKDALTGQEKTKTIVEIQKDEKTGLIGRVEESPLKQFGIKTFNLSINKVKYDDAVEKQIQQQQDAIMQVQTAIAKSKTAEQDALTVEKQGQAIAAKAKWEQEAIKSKEVTKAEMVKDVAKLEKEAAEFTKAKLILEGEGEARKRELVMAADNALDAKLATYERVMKGAFESLSKQKLVPDTLFVSGSGTGGANQMGGSNAMTLIDILTAKTARDLSLDIGTETKKK
jgi:regulator of protease activity HflC (stomatin/prohibitin superfamily)